MTDTPADPIAAEAREIAARVLTEHFEAELNRSPSDPIGARTRLTDRMAAAFGHRMKAAGRAEASAWRPTREVRDAILDAIRVLDRERACVINNYAEDRDEEGDPIALSITDADALREIAEYTSLIERLKGTLPPPPEGGE